MARYYTGTTLYGGGYGTPSFSGRDIPAVLFFDPEGSLSLADILPAAREIFPTPEQPFQARSAMHHTSHRAWLLAPSLRVPAPGGHGTDTRASTFIADLHAPSLTTRKIKFKAAYEECVHLEAVMDICPCNRATERPEGISWGGPTICTSERIFSHLDFVPLASLLAHRTNPNVLEDLPKKAADFTYVSARLLTGKPFGGAVDYLDELSLHEENWEDTRSEWRARAKASAETRRLKRVNCKRCVFNGTCQNWVVRRCEGPKAMADVEAAVRHKLKNYHPLTTGKFTRAQRNALVHLAGDRRKFDARIPTISQRKTSVHLGYFDPSGSFHVFAAVGRRSRTAVFHDWASLCKAIPDLKAFADQKFEPLPAWVYLAYRVLSAQRWYRHVYGFGSSQYALLYIEYTGSALSAHYGNNYVLHWSPYHIEKKCDWTKLYAILAGSGQGYHVPYKEKR